MPPRPVHDLFRTVGLRGRRVHGCFPDNSRKCFTVLLGASGGYPIEAMVCVSDFERQSRPRPA